MLLGEPPRTQYDLNFPLFGIPVRVHPYFWLVALIFGAQRRDAPSVLIWIVAIFVSILIHELGHALVMRAHRYRPWIVLYAMGGLSCYNPRDAYRSGRSGSLEQILISLAGPFAGFLLAAVLVAVLFAAGHRESIEFVGPWGLRPYVELTNLRVSTLLNDIFFISVLWGLVNLLPIYPLDGGQVAREVLLRFSPGDGIRNSLLLSAFAGAAMAMYGLVEWKSGYVALLFGYLAYTSYAALQAYSGHYRNR